MNNRFNFNSFFLYIAILLALIGPLSVIMPLGIFKNLRFASAILVIPFFTFSRDQGKEDFLRLARNLFNIYVIVAIYTVGISYFYHSTGFTYRNIVNIILTIVPLIFSWGIIKYTDRVQLGRLLNFLFWAFTILFIGELIKSGISLGSLTQIFQSNVVTDSDYDTESGISLITGFYYLFYLSKKNYKMALFAALITIIGAKRVAILGIFICTLFYFFFPLKQLSKSRKFYGWLFLGVGIILAIMWDGIITGRYNSFIQSTFGLDPNRFFMGRLNRFQLVFSEASEAPFFGLGLGLGYMENILYYEVGFESAFHGDFYRLYLEFGVILFSFWLYTIGKFASTNRLALTSTLLLIILMQTDNAFLYNRIMFSYFLVLGYSLIKDRHEIR